LDNAGYANCREERQPAKNQNDYQN